MLDNTTSPNKKSGPINSLCIREGCYYPTQKGNGQFPFCSKSCRNKEDYKKIKSKIRALNAIRSELKKQDDLLAELFRKWGSKPFTMAYLQTEGLVDGGYSRQVKQKHTGRLAMIFLFYALLYDQITNTYQIIPKDEL